LYLGGDYILKSWRTSITIELKKEIRNR